MDLKKINKQFDAQREEIIFPALEGIEQNILATILNKDTVLITTVKYLKPYHFSIEKHSIIYKACLLLFDVNEPVNQINVIETLKKFELLDKAGGIKYISQLSYHYISDAYFEQHCKIVFEKWVLREFIKLTNANMIKAKKEIVDPFEIINETMNELDILFNSTSNDLEEKNFADRLPEVINQIKEERLSSVASTFKTVEFPSFNRATGGISPGNLIVISGKFKSGKTRFALSLLKDFAVNSKIPCGLIGFEMDVTEYEKNLLSMQCGIRYSYLRNPGSKNKDGSYILTDNDLERLEMNAEKSFSETKIFISDKSIYDTDVIAKIKFWVKKHHIKIVMIDYLQLIESNKKFERRDLELADISKRLKNLARTENIAIFILVQENESGQSADSKGPLRDSDFWFSIVHPIDEPAYYKSDLTGKKSYGDNNCVVTVIDSTGNKINIDADETIFHIKFKASRHSANGKSFLCKFFSDGKFTELNVDSTTNEEFLL